MSWKAMDGSTKRFPLTFTYLLKICNLLEIERNKEEEPFGGAVSLTALPLDLILPLQAKPTSPIVALAP